ncbi:MAG: hypothetical protein LBR48_08625 [Dysgonamonadaceae bacterium]|jgi:hypothetical protein|nr:hypothetical protein [Dysgonamonadaceae bacterium]
MVAILTNSSKYRPQVSYVLVVSYLIYAVALAIEFKWIFTDDFFMERFADHSQEGLVQSMIVLNKKSILLNYIAAVFVVLIPVYAVGGCLWIGFNLFERVAKFPDCLRMSAISNLIFPVNYMLSVLLRVAKVLPYNETDADNNFRYQSLLALVRWDIPDWLLYPLEKINVTEVVFVLLLGYFISSSFALPFIKSVCYAVLFYGAGLLLWIIFTVFLQFTLY